MQPLIDVNEGIRLCAGSRTLYLRMLARFKSDPTMARLEAALLRCDAQEGFLQAHTLKGLAAQLALPALAAQAVSLCDALRAQSPACVQEAGTTMHALMRTYAQTLSAIASLEP